MNILNINGTTVGQVIGATLLSGIKFLGVQIPFVIGFIERDENVKKKIALYILSALTIALRFSWLSSIRFGISVILLYSVVSVFKALNFKIKNDMYVYMFLSVFAAELLWCAFDGILVYDVIVAIAKGFSVIGGYMLFGKLEGITNELTDKEFLYAIVAIGLMLCGFQDITIL